MAGKSKSTTNTPLDMAIKDVMTTLMPLTKDSPLLLAGIVTDRQKITGTSAKGPWEIYKVEIRGEDGRVQSCSVHEPASAPAIGTFCVIPVVVAQNGGLREARATGQPF